MQSGGRHGPSHPSLALQEEEDPGLAGSHHQAEDQEVLQVPVDQGSLPDHILLQVSLTSLTWPSKSCSKFTQNLLYKPSAVFY